MSDPAALLTWISFLALAALTLGGAVGVVTVRNLFHAALALVACLMGIAGLYLVLAAEFVAAIHVLIYVGAIATLFLFVIMLTARIADADQVQTNAQRVPALVVCALAFAALLAALLGAPWPRAAGPVAAPTVETLGREMLTTYVLAFEVVSLLLIVALIGAVTLARREPPA